MQYQGGKSRIALPIANIINATGGDTFVSLFCGSCAVEAKIRGFSNVILNDKHPYLIAMWQALQSGYALPDRVTQEQWEYIKRHKEEDPALSGFVGFQCSFGGKWFGSYAHNARGDNYAAQGKSSLMRAIKDLQHVKFICKDYKQVPIPTNSVVYADPPYANTAGYSTGAFDNKEFWDCMRILADTGHKVFVSEQSAPPDFECIWEKKVARTLNAKENNQFKVYERLFIYGGTKQ